MTLARDGDPQRMMTHFVGDDCKPDGHRSEAGLHPKGRVCRNDGCYASTYDGKGPLMQEPRVHDPVEGCDFA